MALNGWLKLHRALSDHPIASDPQSLSVWIHLLMLANHVETKRQINGRIVTLSPGQLIASRKSLSVKTGVQESKVERVLKMLQNEQQIEQHGTSKYRVISIVNWDSYQGGEQQNEQQMNNTRTTREQQMNTPEEVIPGGITKEWKEGEEKIKSACVPAKPSAPKKPRAKTETQLANGETWEGYANAYFTRYGTEPVRNAKTNSLINQLVQRLGAEAAPHVAAYYLGMNKTFYVSNLHPLGVLVKDCESIHTQWATNRQMTDTRSRQIDQSQANYDVADEAVRIYNDLYAGGVQ